MTSQKDTLRLQNGVEIPCLGFGTWQTPDGETAVRAVRCAIEAGYTHIDTAQVYGNERSVGEAIRQSGVNRGDLFITTKLWNTKHSYELAMRSFEESMDKLGLDYLDLFLIHWPNPVCLRDNDRWQAANAESWKAMEELVEAGRVRAIGVSNFRPHHLDALLKTAKIMPQVNQIRLCPGDTEDETVAYCRERGILLEAYSPLGTGSIFDVPQMRELAEKYGRTVAQICIRWSLERGYLPLPKSVTPSRIVENLDVFDFSLSAEDVQKIADLKGCVGYAPDPDGVGF